LFLCITHVRYLQQTGLAEFGQDNSAGPRTIDAVEYTSYHLHTNIGYVDKLVTWWSGIQSAERHKLTFMSSTIDVKNVQSINYSQSK